MVKTKQMDLKEINKLAKNIQNKAFLMKEFTNVYLDEQVIVFEYKEDKNKYSLHFNMDIAMFDCIFSYIDNEIIHYTCKRD